MTRSATARGLVVLLSVGMLLTLSRLSAQAQGERERKVVVSVQDALLLPVEFGFAEPTPLLEVVEYLNKKVGIRVVLDQAALGRLDIDADHPVQLALDGVRLKTSLKLILDQVGMTYKVIPEDNLLILTDHLGSEDPAERTLAELKSLHMEMHDLQDAVDEIRKTLGLIDDGGRVRKPTIIEEMPEEEQKPAEKHSRPRPGI